MIKKPPAPPGPPTRADASVIEAGNRDNLTGFSVITNNRPLTSKRASTSKTTKTGG